MAKKAPAAAKKAAAAPAKTAAKAKAPAKKAAAAKKPADRSAAISASWQDPKVAAARSERTAVKVGGETYKSVPEAFGALKLPMGQMVRFRQRVKADGRATFETDKGVKHNFIAVAA